MPAKSKAQFRFMQMCRHSPEHAKGDCPDEETAKEFTRSSSKGLPERKGKRRKQKVSYPKPK
jgi:hypothetical protein